MCGKSKSNVKLECQTPNGESGGAECWRPGVYVHGMLKGLGVVASAVVLVSGLLSAEPAGQNPSKWDLVDYARFVNPLIGTANGENTFPGAVLPFGMFSWSPENTRGDMTRAAAPGLSL